MKLIAKDGVLYDAIGQLCAIEQLSPGVSSIEQARLGLGSNRGKLFHTDKAKAKVTKLYPLAEVLTIR